MRQQIIATILLATVLCITLIIKVLFYPRLYGHNAYYFLSIFWICGALIAIFLLNIIWHRFAGRKPDDKKHNSIAWPNRRETFRIVYPVGMRPILVVEISDHRPRRNLEFPVIDLSQEGSCFMDDGSLGAMEQFSGRIRFKNGDQIKVSGHRVHKSDDRVRVHFSKPLDWSTLLDEQRRVMPHMKPAK